MTLQRGIGLAPTGFRQVRLKAGNTLIKLMDIESPPPTPADVNSQRVSAGLPFLLRIFRDTVEGLKQNGVEFLSEPIGAPDAVGVACAKDPDGILVELVEI